MTSGRARASCLAARAPPSCRPPHAAAYTAHMRGTGPGKFLPRVPCALSCRPPVRERGRRAVRAGREEQLRAREALADGVPRLAQHSTTHHGHWSPSLTAARAAAPRPTASRSPARLAHAQPGRRRRPPRRHRPESRCGERARSRRRRRDWRGEGAEEAASSPARRRGGLQRRRMASSSSSKPRSSTSSAYEPTASPSMPGPARPSAGGCVSRSPRRP